MQEQLADGAHPTGVRSYQLHFHSKTEICIQVKVLLFDNAYLSKVVNDKKSWFMRMKVHDLIYTQIFFILKSLGRLPTTSQYFKPLSPQTLVLATTAIHCALSEYISGENATVMFSQD